MCRQCLSACAEGVSGESSPGPKKRRKNQGWGGESRGVTCQQRGQRLSRMRVHQGRNQDGSQAEVQGGDSTGTHSIPLTTGGVKAMEA